MDIIRPLTCKAGCSYHLWCGSAARFQETPLFSDPIAPCGRWTATTSALLRWSGQRASIRRPYSPCQKDKYARTPLGGAARSDIALKNTASEHLLIPCAQALVLLPVVPRGLSPVLLSLQQALLWIDRRRRFPHGDTVSFPAGIGAFLIGGSCLSRMKVRQNLPAHIGNNGKQGW